VNRRKHAHVAVLLAVATAGVAASCASGGDPDAGEAQPHPRPTWSFYQPPDPLPDAPAGTLIRSEPLAASGLGARDVFAEDPRTTPPWSAGLASNSVGALPADVPLLVMQGGRDPIVVPSSTSRAVRRWCDAGDTVDFQTYPRAAHNVVPAAASDLNRWIAARFHHDSAQDTCEHGAAAHP